MALARLSAQKYNIEFYLCMRECLSDEIVKNIGSECKRIPDLLTRHCVTLRFHAPPRRDHARRGRKGFLL